MKLLELLSIYKRIESTSNGNLIQKYVAGLFFLTIYSRCRQFDIDSVCLRHKESIILIHVQYFFFYLFVL